MTINVILENEEYEAKLMDASKRRSMEWRQLKGKKNNDITEKFNELRLSKFRNSVRKSFQNFGNPGVKCDGWFPFFTTHL